MNYILKNIELNLNKLEKYSNYSLLKNENQSNILVRNIKDNFHHLDINILNEIDMKNIKDELKVTQYDVDYFNDFGIKFLFEIECIEVPCLIF